MSLGAIRTAGKSIRRPVDGHYAKMGGRVSHEPRGQRMGDGAAEVRWRLCDDSVAADLIQPAPRVVKKAVHVAMRCAGATSQFTEPSVSTDRIAILIVGVVWRCGGL